MMWQVVTSTPATTTWPSHTKNTGLQLFLTAPNHLVTTQYVSPHICLSTLSNLHSHLLTVMQTVPSFRGFDHADLYKTTPPMIPTGLNWDSIIPPGGFQRWCHWTTICLLSPTDIGPRTWTYHCKCVWPITSDSWPLPPTVPCTGTFWYLVPGMILVVCDVYLSLSDVSYESSTT